MVSQIRYYGKDGKLKYYENILYYASGQMCGKSLYSVRYFGNKEGGSPSLEYTILYLYGYDGAQTAAVIDTVYTTRYDRESGCFILSDESENNKDNSSRYIYPSEESIEQEKFGVDPARTEQIYDNTQVLPKISEWTTVYLEKVLHSPAYHTMDEFQSHTTSCRFFYMDDDETPELMIRYSLQDYAEFYTVHDGELGQMGSVYSILSYDPGNNSLYFSDERMGHYSETTYKINEGEFLAYAESDREETDTRQLIDLDTGSVIFTLDQCKRLLHALQREKQSIGDMDGLYPRVAGDYLDQVVAAANEYGLEHWKYNSDLLEAYHSGFCGGYFIDLDKNGLPEMVLIEQNVDSYSVPEHGATFEVWSWSDGQAWQILAGELDLNTDSGTEYLRIREGKNRSYLELGYMVSEPDGEAITGEETDVRYFTIDEKGWFGGARELPASEVLSESVTVAWGYEIYLNNSEQFLVELATLAADQARRNQLRDVLDHLTYLGEEYNCRMDRNMAQAYADVLNSMVCYDPDAEYGSHQQAILADIGGDGYPCLITFEVATFWHLDDGAHFIRNAHFYQYESGCVEEVLFQENAAEHFQVTDGDLPIMSVGIVSPETRLDTKPLLEVIQIGASQDSEGYGCPCVQKNYYFVDNGQLTLFHTVRTVEKSSKDTIAYFDDEKVSDLEECLSRASLNFDGYADTIYSINYADQNARDATPTLVAGILLTAYADVTTDKAPEITRRDYSTWGTYPNTIRDVEFAYLCSFGNDASTCKTETEMRARFFESLQAFPVDHPLHTSRTESESNLKLQQIEAVRDGRFSNMEAFVIRLDQKRAIVVFAGTTDMFDALTDLGIGMDTNPATGLMKNVLDVTNLIGTDQIEAGNDVVKKLIQDGYTTIFLTGHSLGGHVAVDATLNLKEVTSCVVFDPPGRGDAIWQRLFNRARTNKVTVYKADGSGVSKVGEHVGKEYTLKVKENWPVEDKFGSHIIHKFTHNHGIKEIAEALGGMQAVGWSD